MKEPEKNPNREIDDLLDQALDLPEENRIPYVERVCKDNIALRNEVISILKGAKAAPSFLSKNVFEFAASLIGDHAGGSEIDHIPGINEYDIEAELDRGGMGVVYKARHISLGRVVAIKILQQGPNNSSLLSRFELEQRILSRLEHPNIARLYEIGLTENGLPYFAMEYIDGMHFDKFCDENQLSIEERLEKFKLVIGAINFAHRNAVVHRDIKPSNIMVSATEGIKLLDFGIAKLLDADDDFEPLTRPKDRLLTPKYAAPEQVKSEPITIATDVYQLGVVLYKVLTGHLPFPTAGRSNYEIEEAVCKKEPIRPSNVIHRIERFKDQVVDPQYISHARNASIESLTKTIKGDLDAILLKAIRKEPGRRYTSTEAFLEDIKRYENNLPVLAMSDSIKYRTGKFIQRHRFGISVAAAFLVFIVGFSITLVKQQIKANQQQVVVNRETARANAANEYVLGLFQQVNPLHAEGRQITARSLVYAGIKGLDDLEGGLLLKASILNVMAELSYQVALYHTADSLSRLALDIHLSKYGENHVNVAESMHWIGMVLIDKEEYEEALTYLKKSLEIRELNLPPDEPKSLESLSALADLYFRIGEFNSADSLYQIALEKRAYPSLAIHHEIFSCIDGQGRIRFRQGIAETEPLIQREKYDEASRLFREALRLRLNHLGARDPRTAHTMFNLANLLQYRDSLSVAQEFHQSALDIYEYVFKDSSDLIATSRYGLAGTLRGLGKLEEAEKMYLASAKMYEKSFGLSHSNSAFPLLALGQLYFSQREYKNAEQVLRSSISIFESSDGGNQDTYLFAKALLGNTLSELKKYDEAEIILVDSFQKVENPEYRKVFIKYLVNFYENQGKHEKAKEYLQLLE